MDVRVRAGKVNAEKLGAEMLQAKMLKVRCKYSNQSSDPQSPSPDQTGLPSGDQSAVEPPGPIPNPEVKRCSANGSETIGLVRVGRRQVYARLQA